MKKLIITTAVAILAGMASSWAFTNTFVVTQLKGTLTTINGVTPITATQLSTNQLLFIVNSDEHESAIVEVSGTDTNTLMDDFRVAYVGGGKLNTDMDGEFTPVDSSVPIYDGDLQFTCKISPAPEKAAPTKVSATIIGVWTEAPDTIFKGTLKGTKP